MVESPRKISLLVVFLTVFIDLLGFGMVIPLLPIYAKEFTVDESGWVIGALMSSFSAMQFLFAPVWGRLSDRIGRRPVLMIGLLGSTIFYTLFGLATLGHSLLWLFVSRIGAGICGATIPTAQAYIADVTTLETRTKGMALIGAAFGLGFTFGPLIGAAALLSSRGSGALPVPTESLAAAQQALDHSRLAASPWPGYVAAGLSAAALALAFFRLPESLRPGSEPAGRALIDFSALSTALAIPSIGLLLATSFMAIVSFANFESTLSLLLKEPKGHFEFQFHQVLLVFAYIGFMLTFAQGFLVRRLAGRLPDAVLATTGGLVMIVGYALIPIASRQGSLPLLLVSLAVEVIGFAFLPTSLNGLISRRSDPAQQGGILGVTQSVGSLARIVGPVVGIRLFSLSATSATLPFWVAAVVMVVALVLVAIAARSGRDFVPAS